MLCSSLSRNNALLLEKLLHSIDATWPHLSYLSNVHVHFLMRTSSVALLRGVAGV